MTLEQLEDKMFKVVNKLGADQGDYCQKNFAELFGRVKPDLNTEAA